MKKCFKCNIEKPISEFYKHPQMGDGHLGKCKLCTRIDVMRDRARNLTNPEWVKAERARCRAKIAKARKEGRAKTYPKAAEAQKKWDRTNRHKKNAHLRLHRAVAKGLIAKPSSCTCCKKPTQRLQAHHWDYTKPLDVIWLCVPCHAFQHWKDNQLAVPVNFQNL